MSDAVPATFAPPLLEAEQFTKPGTANVSPSDLKKLAPLMKHYGSKAHPFTACKRDQMKHGLTEDHANRRCAVLKDLIRGTTKWRSKEEVEAAERIVATATARFRQLCEEHGAGPVCEAALADDRPAGADSMEREAFDLNAVLEQFSGIAHGPNRNFGKVARQRKAARQGMGNSPDWDESKYKRAMDGKFITKGQTRMFGQQARQALGAKGRTFNERDIRRFQRQNNLVVDGKIGSQTAAALLGGPAQDPGELKRGQVKRLLRPPQR